MFDRQNELNEVDSGRLALFPVVKAMANAFDLISSTVVGHHLQVSYIALRLGKELNLSDSEIKKLVLTSLIHDLGVFYLNQDYQDLDFDNRDNRHAEVGYHLSKDLFPDREIPRLIRYHHHDWDSTKDQDHHNKVPALSHLLHLADRIAVQIERKLDILEQARNIEENIKRQSHRFMPEALERFFKLTEREYFWLDLISISRIERELDSFFSQNFQKLQLKELENISILMSHIIDFRSPYTAAHTQGVAFTAEKLADYLDFENGDIKMMRIAGFFHDIGKLIVPLEILHKSDRLSNEEWAIMKTHTYYTYQALSTTDKLERIKEWGSFHHEKLNGQGYPFHLEKEELSTGARIMAVADVFTAISEDRPYREGMSPEKIKEVLEEMADNRELDRDIVALVNDNFTEFKETRDGAQSRAEEYYQDFKVRISEFLNYEL